MLTTATFNVAAPHATSVKFGTSGETEANGKGHIENVNGDSDLDMVLHFRMQNTGISAGDAEACLTGKTTAGAFILSCDSIQTVP